MREALNLYPDDSLVFDFFEGDEHGYFRVSRGMRYYAASWAEWQRERRERKRRKERVQVGDSDAE